MQGRFTTPLLKRLLDEATPAQLREARKIALDHFIACRSLELEVLNPDTVMLEALHVVTREGEPQTEQAPERERYEPRRDYTSTYSGGYGYFLEGDSN